MVILQQELMGRLNNLPIPKAAAAEEFTCHRLILNPAVVQKEITQPVEHTSPQGIPAIQIIILIITPTIALIITAAKAPIQQQHL